jgi:hypothetical protein
VALNRKDRREIRISHKSKFDAAKVKAQLAQAWEAFNQHVEECRALALKSVTPEQARELLMMLLAKPSEPKALTFFAATDKAPVTTAQQMEQAAVAEAQVDGGSLLTALLAKKDNQPEEQAADKNRDPRALAKVLNLFEGAGKGANHEGVHGTAWGLLNAYSEYTDHVAGRTANNRVDAAWFGRTDDTKAEFQKLLLAA